MEDFLEEIHLLLIIIYLSNNKNEMNTEIFFLIHKSTFYKNNVDNLLTIRVFCKM